MKNNIILKSNGKSVPLNMKVKDNSLKMGKEVVL